MTLFVKLLTSSLLILSVSLGSVSVVGYLQSRQIVEQASGQRLVTAAEQGIQSLNTHLDLLINTLSQWRSHPAFAIIDGPLPENQEDQIFNLVSDQQDFENFWLLKADNQPHFMLDPENLPAFLEDYKALLTRNEIVISHFYWDPILQDSVVYLFVPLADRMSTAPEGGLLVKIVATNLSLKAMDSSSLDNQDHLILFHKDGTTLESVQAQKPQKMQTRLDQSVYDADKSLWHYQDSDHQSWMATYYLPGSSHFGAWVQAKEEVIFAPAQHLMEIVALISAIALVLSAALVYLLTRKISRPLQAITRSMTHLAEGKSVETLAHIQRKDEIGDLARAMNVFQQNAQALSQVEQEKTAGEIARRAENQAQMTHVIDEFDSNIAQQVERLCDIVSDVQGHASMMMMQFDTVASYSKDVNQATEAASGSVSAVALTATDLSTSITELMSKTRLTQDNVQSTLATVSNADDQIKALSAAADEIGSIVSFISNLANQTNLLALNATIEAARAGDAGKGFAVVAGEVKNLASQTTSATDSIADQIENIQQAARAVVTIITDIQNQIENLQIISGTMNQAMVSQEAATGDIATSTQAAASENQHVSSTVQDMTRLADNAQESATNVCAHSQDVTEMTRNLQQDVQKFVDFLKQRMAG